MASRAGKSQSRTLSGSSRRGSRGVPGDFAGGFPNPDDFCNSFWDENGYDALAARMRSSSRTLEELRAFYKEKAAIEEDYGKRMAKLARMSVGKHETGTLRMALDRVRQEMARSGDSHEKMAQAIRTSLMADLKRFEASREDRRKAPQAVVDKAYKERVRQEGLAAKAKDKYKADCISINGLTAQTNLTQGRDLDKVQQKLEKHEATVQVNRSEYEAYTNALGETFDNWTHEWRSYCDLCQDLEEERMDFLRFSLWDFANAMSLICVTDDESCEEVRRALERFQTAPEIAEVSRTIGTGAKILDAPIFVDYSRGHHDDSKRHYRTANFPRSSARKELVHSGELLADLTNAIRPGPMGPPTPMDEYDPRRGSSRPSSRPPSQADIRADAPLDGPGQNVISPTVSASTGPSPHFASHSILAAPTVGADGTVLQRSATPAQAFESAVSPTTAEPPTLPASFAQSTSRQSIEAANQRPPSRGPLGSIGAAIQRKLSRGSTAVPAEAPTQASISRPASTAFDRRASRAADRPATGTTAAEAFQRASTPQTAAQEPSNAAGKVDEPEQEDPLMARLRALRTLSNSQKRTSSPIVQAAAAENLARQSSQDLRERPPSRGADYEDRRRSRHESGRPSSVYGGTGREASPAPGQYGGQVPYSSTSPAIYGQQQQRTESPRPQSQSMGQIARPPSRGANYQQGYGQQQTTSQPPLGIALDSRGQVRQDSLADDYARRQQEQQASYTQQNPAYQTVAQQYAQQHAGQRPPSQQYASPPPQQPAQSAYGGQTPAPYDHRQQYDAPQPYEQPRTSYEASRPSYEAPRQSYETQQHGRQDSYGQSARQRSNSQYGGQNGYGATDYRQQSPAPAPQPQRGPSPAVGPPPGAPAGQSNGRPIMFYVQALYDYVATIDEEFSFQTGDIIAVFSTDADGWWQGELLDEDRKRIGGNTFPSNFCQLLN